MSDAFVSDGGRSEMIEKTTATGLGLPCNRKYDQVLCCCTVASTLVSPRSGYVR